jgi:hypothetical protein
VELVVAVDEMFVDLVGDDPDVVLHGPLADGFDLVSRIDSAGRVRRRHEHERLGLVCASSFELVDRRPEAVGRGGEHRHGDTASEGDGLRIRGPIGSREDHFVAGVQQRGEGVVDRMLAAVGHQDVGRRALEAAVAQGLGGKCFLELGLAADGAVFVVDRVAAGFDRGLDDVGRRREVGLTGAEADDVLACCPKGLCLVGNGKGCRRGDGADAA